MPDFAVMLQQYPIDDSLPPEITTAASQLLQYQRRPVFSWPWWWRRMVFFGPVAIVLAIGDGNGHGMFAQDAAQGLSVAWRFAVEALIFIGGGTLLATAIRRAGLRQTLERFLIMLSVIAGFFLWDSSSRWADDYHARLMCEIRGVQPLECADPRKPIDGTLLGIAMQLSVPVGLYFLFGGGMALVSYGREQRGWVELRRRRDRERLELHASEANARLAVLQAQIEPHFLFNTLASLRSLVRTEPGRAEATIDALVEHLRATLPRMRDGSVEAQSTLEQQLDICRSYLEVMRVRMGARLTYDIDASAPSDLPMPPLMLLSLVENAVKHGVEPEPGAHVIAVKTRLLALDGRSRLEVTVSDDGAGLREGAGSGVGLANIRAQLSLRYGREASLDLQNREGGGVVSTLVIPVAVASR